MRNILRNYYEFGPVVQEEISFKDISYLEPWQPFCSVQWNHMCYFGRWHYQKRFCEIILKLDQWFRRRCCLKTFLSRALAAPLFSRVESFVQFWTRALQETFP